MIRFALNTEGHDFIVGDMHGHYDLFQEQLERIEFNPEVDRMFSVGDLIDRGPESLKCLTLIDEPWFYAVIGNHEDMMLHAEHSYTSQIHWMRNGGTWAGEIDNETLNEWRVKIEKLPIAITVETIHGDVGICHAQPPSNDWADAQREDPYTQEGMIWGREIIRMPEYTVEGVYKTVHGHTPVKEVVARGNVVFIDTGAFATGNLTVLNLDEI